MIGNYLNNESVELIYSKNNVVFERSNLYGDFIQSLMLTIFDTYMGDEITDKDQKLNHFNWCWEKTVTDFECEGFKFIENADVYSYFLVFCFEVFYSLENKLSNKNVNKNILKLWFILFDFNGRKTQSDIDTYIEVYGLFDDIKKRLIN